MINELKSELMLLLRIYSYTNLQVGHSTTLSFLPSAQAAELQPASKTGRGDETSLHVVKRIRVS